MLVAVLKTQKGQPAIQLDPNKTYPADQIEWVPLGFRRIEPEMADMVVSERELLEAYRAGKPATDVHYSNAHQGFVRRVGFMPKKKTFSSAILSDNAARFDKLFGTDKRILNRRPFE